MSQIPPAPLSHLYDQDGQPVVLEEAFAKGSEGAVHVAASHPGAVAKIMHQQPLPQSQIDKLFYMVDNQPPFAASSAYRIAWPTSVVLRTKKNPRAVGFLMPQMDADKFAEIGTFFNPARRGRRALKRNRAYTFLHLLGMALNLSHAVAHIHSQGHVIGDLNSRNILASDRGQIAVIDTDSFHIIEEGTERVHRCSVGTPEYTPPRLQGVPFAKRDRKRDDDQFALAVMIYQLLFQGQHPFSGQYVDRDEKQDLTTLPQRIAQGSFVHGPQTKINHSPGTGAYIIWRDSPLKKQFRTAFRRKGKRTEANEWAEAIERSAADIRPCPDSKLHHYFPPGPCTWCQYRERTGHEPFAFPDPFF